MSRDTKVSARINRRQILKATGTGVMLSGLAGCTNNQGNGGGDTPTAGGGSATPSEQTLKVGVPVPLSGPYSYLGETQVRGIEMLFNETNQSDEVLPNTTIEWTTRDTKTDPKEGLNKARELVQQEEVDILLGPASSAVAASIAKGAANMNVPFFITLSGDPSLTTGENCQFTTVRLQPTTEQAGASGGYWGASTLGSDCYFLYPDYNYGNAFNRFAPPQIKRGGGQIVKKAVVPPAHQDFSDVIDEIKRVDPDWVYSGLVAGNLPFTTQVAERGLDVPIAYNFITSDTIGNLTQQQFDGLPEIYRAVIRYTREIDSEENAQFTERYMNQFNEPPIYASETGYMTAKGVVVAVGNANQEISTETIIRGAEGMTVTVPRGEIPVRECDHQGLPPIYSSRVTGIDQDTKLGTNEIVDKRDGADFIRSCDERSCSF